SREKFDQVTTALAVLTDAERRRHYDATGKVDPPPADDRRARALNLVMGEIAKVGSTAEKMKIDIEEVNLVDDALHGLKEQLQQAEGQTAKAKRYGEKARKIAARFRAKKDKTNVIGPMVAQWGYEHDRNVAKGDDQVAVFKMAIAILEEHVF